jgi:hypothetical protein
VKQVVYFDYTVSEFLFSIGLLVTPPRSQLLIPSWSQAQEKEEGWTWG